MKAIIGFIVFIVILAALSTSPWTSGLMYVLGFIYEYGIIALLIGVFVLSVFMAIIQKREGREP